MGKRSEVCACGVKVKVHARRSRRNQLPDVKTDRFGVPRPGAGRRVRKEAARG